MSSVTIDREILEGLIEPATQHAVAMGEEGWADRADAIFRTVDAARVALAVPGSGSAHRGIFWRDYPWLAADYDGPLVDEHRWLCVLPFGSMMECTQRPKLSTADGWQGGGHVQLYGQVDLKGANWRYTLREVW